MPKMRHNDRRCLGTGDPLYPGAHAIRFVVDPSGILTPDLAEKLPGRGAWIAADRSAFSAAIKKGAFARALRAPAAPPGGVTGDELAAQIETLLTERALGATGMARRAGQVISGFEKVKSGPSDLMAYLTPIDGAADGIQRITRTLDAAGSAPHLPLPVSAERLGVALGLDAAVHVGLTRGSAAEKALWEWQRLLKWGSASE